MNWGVCVCVCVCVWGGGGGGGRGSITRTAFTGMSPVTNISNSMAYPSQDGRCPPGWSIFWLRPSNAANIVVLYCSMFYLSPPNTSGETGIKVRGRK